LNTSQSFVLTFVPNTTIAAFGSLADEPRSIDEAVAYEAPKLSVAQVGPHVLVASSGSVWDAPVLSTNPAGGVTVMCGQDAFELSTFDEPGRNRQFHDGAVNSEEGEPLPVESVFDEIADPTTAHLELVCRLAGIRRDDLDRLEWYALVPRWKKALSRLFGR